jgi:hypothetical protein
VFEVEHSPCAEVCLGGPDFSPDSYAFHGFADYVSTMGDVLKLDPNAHEIANRAMDILNGHTPPLPRKSAARTYVQTLLKDGPDAAHRLLLKLNADPTNLVLSEDEMNSSGHELMGADNRFHLPEDVHLDAAIDVFHTNVNP